MPTRPCTALVLAGGAARGAYEVGVVQYILDDLGAESFDILSGTSVGAISTMFLAAHADAPRRGAHRLLELWRSLRVHEALQVRHVEVARMLASLILPPRVIPGWRRGGLFDPAPLARALGTAPIARIPEHLRAGRLRAVALGTTQVRTGRTVIFVEQSGESIPWDHDPTVVARAARLGVEHAMASAAIPFLFPAVAIGGEDYCDGALRQNVPLSPARKLGADLLLVVTPHYLEEAALAAPAAREAAFKSPVFLLGKVLDTLLLDRIDNDLDRLERINALLEAGTRRFGSPFVPELNRALGAAPGRELRVVSSLCVRASRDIGALAADWIRSREAERRVRAGYLYALRWLADREARAEADLVSYLLFDGAFADLLIQLGRADAHARRHELAARLAAAPDRTSAAGAGR
jgi:NTE family protein